MPGWSFGVRSGARPLSGVREYKIASAGISGPSPWSGVEPPGVSFCQVRVALAPGAEQAQKIPTGNARSGSVQRCSACNATPCAAKCGHTGPSGQIAINTDKSSDSVGAFPAYTECPLTQPTFSGTSHSVKRWGETGPMRSGSVLQSNGSLAKRRAAFSAALLAFPIFIDGILCLLSVATYAV